MGVSTTYLPDNSQSIADAYNLAYASVNTLVASVPGPFYQTMTYNLGGHYLALWSPDIDGVVYRTQDGVGYGFFAWLRLQNNMLNVVTGTVSSSGDEGTSVSLVVPKQAENLTLDQLQLMTTIWGRTYLGYAQRFGTNWGLS